MEFSLARSIKLKKMKRCEIKIFVDALPEPIHLQKCWHHPRSRERISHPLHRVILFHRYTEK